MKRAKKRQMRRPTDLVEKAILRMTSAPLFFTRLEWEALASHDGPVVSGNPSGKLPENLSEDDEE